MTNRDTMSSVLTLATGVVLFDREGRVLLVKENYGRRRWGLPGGVIESGESPHEAAMREVREETGLSVELDHLIALYFLRTTRDGLRFIFAGRIVSGEPAVPASGEVAELRWFAPEALPDRMTHMGPIAISDAVSGGCGVFREIDAHP